MDIVRLRFPICNFAHLKSSHTHARERDSAVHKYITKWYRLLQCQDFSPKPSQRTERREPVQWLKCLEQPARVSYFKMHFRIGQLIQQTIGWHWPMLTLKMCIQSWNCFSQHVLISPAPKIYYLVSPDPTFDPHLIALLPNHGVKLSIPVLYRAHPLFNISFNECIIT